MDPQDTGNPMLNIHINGKDNGHQHLHLTVYLVEQITVKLSARGWAFIRTEYNKIDVLK